jgi:hypothetical protein
MRPQFFETRGTHVDILIARVYAHSLTGTGSGTKAVSWQSGDHHDQESNHVE